MYRWAGLLRIKKMNIVIENLASLGSLSKSKKGKKS